QDFDAVEVEEIEDRSRQRRVVDVVDVETDTRLEGRIEIGLADSANEADQHRSGKRATAGQGHVRGLGADLVDRALPARIEQLAGDCGNRNGSILNALLLELRRNDDFLQ